MLQQTTVKVVVPFYKNFIKEFPSVKILAQSPLEKVYKYWAGLGYYSRARNIHLSAREISRNPGFPKTFKELLKLPGFGNYTARAVSSQAFGEAVGVVDGNVIRVLCRRMGLALEFWKSQGQKKLQEFADQYALSAQDPGILNQALMELGATVCTPKNPTCFLCPLNRFCVAFKKNKIDNLPLKKPKKQREIWLWNIELYRKEREIAFVKNQYAPFLKNQMIFPGQVSKKSNPPRFFDLQHSITHHKIYIRIKKTKNLENFGKKELIGQKDFIWIPLGRIKEKSPFSIIKKTLDRAF